MVIRVIKKSKHNLTFKIEIKKLVSRPMFMHLWKIYKYRKVCILDVKNLSNTYIYIF